MLISKRVFQTFRIWIFTFWTSGIRMSLFQSRNERGLHNSLPFREGRKLQAVWRRRRRMRASHAVKSYPCYGRTAYRRLPFREERKLQAVWRCRRRMRAKHRFVSHQSSAKPHFLPPLCRPADDGFRSWREREEGRKERRIKVVVVVVGGVETVENRKIP